MPFITEELWQRLPHKAGARSISLELFPEGAVHWPDSESEEQMAILQEVIIAARNVRAELKMDPKARVPAQVSSADSEIRWLLEQNRDGVLRLAALSELAISGDRLGAAGGVMRAAAKFELKIMQADTTSAEAEILRLEKEKERLERDIQSKQTRVSDDTFRNRAPAEVVRQMEATLSERRSELDKILARLAQLGQGASGSAAS
jgi:valyl-tRNA synthetase